MEKTVQDCHAIGNLCFLNKHRPRLSYHAARAREWGNGIYEAFEAEYTGTIIARYTYLDEWGAPNDFHPILQEAENIADSDNVAILLLSFDEVIDIIIQASETDAGGALLYPKLYGQGSEPRVTPWFGTESTGRSQRIIDDAPEQANHLKLLSGLLNTPDSPEFIELSEKYQKVTGYEASYYTATFADAAWLIALSVLETGSSSAVDVIDVLPDIASSYYGYSGLCTLNEAGDRESGYLDIWGFYRRPDGTVYFKEFGNYDGETDIVTWY